jgi:FAD/FMN-containing dehydrogenase
MRVVQVRVLGGAVARVPADATAYAHRARRIMLNVAAFYDAAEHRRARQAWVDDVVAALDQGIPGVYVNFLGDDRLEQVRRAYPDETWRRLIHIKRRYDPTNLFRRNHNILPANT